MWNWCFKIFFGLLVTAQIVVLFGIAALPFAMARGCADMAYASCHNETRQICECDQEYFALAPR